jgi:BirA family biotin operon repressor/biotin-[acetyl-CoA-carboxylase] ligase
MPGIVARQERFAVVGSTNDVVRGWLADGTPEVCIAIADEQTAGRGRAGRPWTAPPGHALLTSLGFRPTWLPAARLWQLSAIVSLAMAEAGEFLAGMRAGAIRLKWPNDLVVEDEAEGSVRKLAGVLGESDGIGSDDPRAVVGIGVNADWPVEEFPADLSDTMTSLSAAGSRRVDERELLDAFLASLAPQVEALRVGRFEAETWSERQITTGRLIRLDEHGQATTVVRARGVDGMTGALVVDAQGTSERERHVYSADVVHVRLAGPVEAGV